MIQVMRLAVGVGISFIIISPPMLAVESAKPKEEGRLLHTWRDSTGKYRVVAEFVELSGGEVSLQREDGTRIRVPLERLSAGDRAYAERASHGGSDRIALAKQAGVDGGQSPATDPDDPTVWPNRISHANSDPWIAENHDRLRVMRPRALVINFSNEHSLQHIRELTGKIILGLAEGSRWHGYANPQAPAFLKYRIVKVVDLRDADRKTGDSRRMPAKPAAAGTTNLPFRYASLFSEDFATLYGFADPDRAGKFLTLGELVERGMVHEVWAVVSGNTQAERQVGMWESIELKAVYSPDFKKIPDKRVHCGNGSDPDQPWIGRSLRIGCINASRGPGCFLESLSHSFEGMCSSEAIPYIRPYFAEFAGFDIDKRYKTPFGSFYGADLRNRPIEYPDPHTAIVPHGDKMIRIDNYVAVGSNVHFTPNGRSHYDTTNLTPMLSTIEDWRIGSDDGGRDRAKPWTVNVLKPYEKDFGDCMGPWLVYWRENMPGLDNKAKDNDGKAMKNWWPFLFY